MTEKIKVLQVMDKCAIRGSPIHGVSRLLITWWPEFAASEVEMTLCVLRAEGGCADFLNADIDVEDLDRGKMDPRTILDMIRIIRRDNIQILHTHGYGATTFGRIAGVLTRTPVIVHEHMVDANIPSYQKAADYLLSPFTTKGVAISNAVRDFMTGPRSVPSQRMVIVNNSVPAEYCRIISEQQKSQIREELDIPAGRAVVGIVGRLDEVKGHQYFLESAAILLKKIPDLYFVIVGDGELKESLSQQAVDLGISDKTRFLGHRNDVIEIISILDILAVSSLSEGFSIAIAEAMAQSKPVVATAVGGIPDIVDDGKSGLLVPPADPEAMADAIETILAEPDRAQRYGQYGHSKCCENYLANHSMKALCSIYHEIAD